MELLINLLKHLRENLWWRMEYKLLENLGKYFNYKVNDILLEFFICLHLKL